MLSTEEILHDLRRWRWWDPNWKIRSELSDQLRKQRPDLELPDQIWIFSTVSHARGHVGGMHPNGEPMQGLLGTVWKHRRDRALLPKRIEHANMWFDQAKQSPEWKFPWVKRRAYHALSCLIYDLAAPGHWDAQFRPGILGFPTTDMVFEPGVSVVKVGMLFQGRKKALFPRIDGRE